MNVNPFQKQYNLQNAQKTLSIEMSDS